MGCHGPGTARGRYCARRADYDYYLLLFIVLGGGADGLCSRGWGWIFAASWALVGGAVCVPIMPWVEVASQGLA